LALRIRWTLKTQKTLRTLQTGKDRALLLKNKRRSSGVAGFICVRLRHQRPTLRLRDLVLNRVGQAYK
jgi:hypothetical protein